MKREQTITQIDPVEAVVQPPNELADLLVEHLEQLGVEYIFGVPGGAIEPLYNAMARSSRRGGIRPIVARHETGAAFMADGYARETGKLGVCCSTTGPGATNMITGAASAYLDNVPLLIITAQTALHLFGKHALQESSCTAVNTVAMFQQCTRYSSLISHRGQLESKLAAAIAATQGIPSGPAHLSIPMDVLSAQRRKRAAASYSRLDTLLQRPSLIDAGALEVLSEEVKNAKRIVLLLGESCGSAIDEIMDFADLFQTPIMTCMAGKRWVNHQHPLYRGVLGFAGHASASDAFEDERNDLILAVGTQFGEMMFKQWEENEDVNSKIIHIDENLEHFSHSPLAKLHVCGSVKQIFKKLVNSFADKQTPGLCLAVPSERQLEEESSSRLILDDPDGCYSDAVPIKPHRLMTELSRKIPTDARVIIDAGNTWAWATHYLNLNSSGKYRAGTGFAAMTWAIGASVGTALGAGGALAVCITGDGSFLMSGQELSTAVAEKLPLVYIILHDGALGMVKHGQRLGGAEEIAHELPDTDFAQMARAVGANGVTIKTIEDLEAIDFTELLQRGGPTLLDVYIDGEEVPPIGARMKTLGR